MKYSRLMVFSIFLHVQRQLERKKKVFFSDKINPTSNRVFDRSSIYVRSNVNRIYNEIENSYYTLNDYMIALLCSKLHGKFDFRMVRKKEIVQLKGVFNEKRLSADKEFLLALKRKLSLNMKDLFGLRENQESIIFELLEKEYISDAFSVKYSDYFLDDYLDQKRNKYVKVCKVLNSFFNVKEFGYGEEIWSN